MGDVSGGGAMILITTGLLREARLLSGPHSLAVVSGGDPAALARRLAAAPAADAVLSAGLAGALAADLAPGDCVIAEEVVADGASPLPAHRGWRIALSERLPGARRGRIAGADAMLLGRREKAWLRTRCGADAVDMESHVAARFAAGRGLPFAAVRVISDGAHRDLPSAARAGLRADGGLDAAAVALALVRRPGDLGPLLRTAREAETAFRALAGLRARLGGRYALP